MGAQLLIGAILLLVFLGVFFWKNIDARFATLYLGGALGGTLLRKFYRADWHLPQVVALDLVSPLLVAFVLIALLYYAQSMDKTPAHADRKGFIASAVWITYSVTFAFELVEIVVRMHSDDFSESIVFYVLHGVYGTIVVRGWSYIIRPKKVRQ